MGDEEGGRPLGTPDEDRRREFCIEEEEEEEEEGESKGEGEGERERGGGSGCGGGDKEEGDVPLDWGEETLIEGGDVVLVILLRKDIFTLPLCRSVALRSLPHKAMAPSLPAQRRSDFKANFFTE